VLRLEARVLQVEHDETDRWGGAIALEGGRRYYVNPQPGHDGHTPSWPRLRRGA
jgi:nitrogen fixation protein